MTSSNPSVGAASATIVASSAGCFSFGLLYLLGDKSKVINKALNFYVPSGALSGVLIAGSLIWLVCWVVLAARWKNEPPAVGSAIRVALVLLLASLLFTFPPFVRLI